MESPLRARTALLAGLALLLGGCGLVEYERPRAGLDPRPSVAPTSSTTAPTSTSPPAAVAPGVPSQPTGQPTAAVPTSRPPSPADARLLAAADRGDIEVVRAALAAGANVNVRGAAGQPPLVLAAASHRAEVARVLVEAGGDVNQQDDRKDSAFLLAGAEGDVATLRVVAPSADPTILNRFGGTALIPAAERGHVEAVRFLLEATRVDVNHVNNLGWTALLEAIVLSSGGPPHQEIVRLLLAHGADPNIADRDGVTPLRHARSRGYLEIARTLEAAGGR